MGLQLDIYFFDVLSLFHKHRLQLHLPNPVDFAIYIVVLVNKPLYPHLGPDLGDL